MAGQSGGPGTYHGTGNTFIGTGSYVLGGDQLAGLTGVAGATVASSTTANITLGLNLGVAGLSALTTATITALAGGTANLVSLLGSVGTTNLIANGGTISVASGIGALSNVHASIGGGGGFSAFGSLIGAASADTVAFGAGGGTFTIEAAAVSAQVLTGLVIAGLAANDIIDDQNINFSSVRSYGISGGSGAQVVTFYSDAAHAMSLGGLTFAASTFSNSASPTYYTAGQGPVRTTSHNNILQISNCFLRGTMIATPAGEITAECLRPGDMVSVIEHDRVVAKPIVWTGSGSMRAADYDRRDEAFPIRIRRHAFADNVPHRDLLVTPEHCILTEAGLTPVRMLVNSASILIDHELDEYDFFHVELDSHGILLSEGLATESYLDTGNRERFTDADAAVTIRHDPRMAAPLAVARDIVEPIWQRLAARAELLGLHEPDRFADLTDQPDLRLLLDDGQELTARWRNEMHHLFHIPHGVRPIRLLSRTAMPADVFGPFVDDRRILGVAVDRLVLWIGLSDHVMPATGFTLDGWYPDEGGRHWTNGNAWLDLPCAEVDTFVDIHLAATLPYRDAAPAAA